jgi:hypothetical protein
VKASAHQTSARCAEAEIIIALSPFSKQDYLGNLRCQPLAETKIVCFRPVFHANANWIKMAAIAGEFMADET